MKVSERSYVFDGILHLAETLKDECDLMCEVIDCIEDVETISKRVSILEDDADNIAHEITYFYDDHKLVEDKEAMAVYDIVLAIEECTDKVDDLVKDLVRMNVTNMKDNAVVSIINAEAASAKLMDVIFAIKDYDGIHKPFKEIIELDHFKIESEKMYDIHMRKLFSSNDDILDIIRWKEIYMSFRELFESYEDISEKCSKYIMYLD